MKHSSEDEGLFWSPVYDVDRELEKVFRDMGGHASRLAFIRVYRNLIIDDKKLRMR